MYGRDLTRRLYMSITSSVRGMLEVSFTLSDSVVGIQLAMLMQLVSTFLKSLNSDQTLGIGGCRLTASDFLFVQMCSTTTSKTNNVLAA